MPATKRSAPATFSQPSRKGKKAWRKNVDLAEVETGLEELRVEVIKGGVVSEKADEALFVMDTSGDAQVRKSRSHIRPLKSDEILAARSPVPGLVHPWQKAKNGKTTDGLPVKQQNKKKAMTAAELERLKLITHRSEGSSLAAQKTKKDIKKQKYDVWTQPTPAEIVKAKKAVPESLDFLENPVEPAPPKTLHMAPVAIDKTVEGKAVVVAKPGQSYNPAIQEWSELVKTAAEIEEERERKRAEVAARKAEIKALAEQIIENIIEENSEDEEQQAGDDMDVDKAEKKLPKRKTKSERKKAERAVKRAQDELHQAKLKAQKQQLAQLASHKKEQSVSTTTESAEEKARRAPKRLGPYRLQHEPLELQLSDELAESLRTLKPEGNALRERFVSMQKRGILEVRVPVKERRKYELKDIEKWSYKDWKHTPNRN